MLSQIIYNWLPVVVSTLLTTIIGCVFKRFANHCKTEGDNLNKKVISKLEEFDKTNQELDKTNLGLAVDVIEVKKNQVINNEQVTLLKEQLKIQKEEFEKLTAELNIVRNQLTANLRKKE